MTSDHRIGECSPMAYARANCVKSRWKIPELALCYPTIKPSLNTGHLDKGLISTWAQGMQSLLLNFLGVNFLLHSVSYCNILEHILDFIEAGQMCHWIPSHYADSWVGTWSLLYFPYLPEPTDHLKSLLGRQIPGYYHKPQNRNSQERSPSSVLG